MKFETPDTRGWIVIGLFALTGIVLGSVICNPSLTDNQGFMLIAQAIVISGLIAVVNYFFGASKGATEANARADKALDVASNAQEQKK